MRWSPFHEHWTILFFVSLQIFYFCVVFLSETVFVNTVVASLLDCGYNNCRDGKRAQIRYLSNVHSYSVPWFRPAHTRQPSKRLNNVEAKWKKKKRTKNFPMIKRSALIRNNWIWIFAVCCLHSTTMDRKITSRIEFVLTFDGHQSASSPPHHCTLHSNETQSARRRWINNKKKTLLHFPLA